VAIWLAPRKAAGEDELFVQSLASMMV